MVWLRLHGALRRAATEPDGRTARIVVRSETTVGAALAALGLGADEVWRIAGDGSFLEVSQTLHDGDCLEVFPPLGGG